MLGTDLLYDLQLNLGLKEDEKPELLLRLLNSVSTKALRYCRLKFIPQDMKPIIVEIAADRYRRQNIGSSDEKTTVSTVTDGDQSVSFKSASSEAILSTGFTKSETDTLNLFRKAW